LTAIPVQAALLAFHTTPASLTPLQVLATCTNALTKLSFTEGQRSCKLEDFPDCPFLSTLEELALSGDMARPPPALAAATRLRCLELTGSYKSHLEISMRDVQHALHPLQHLTELRLNS